MRYLFAVTRTVTGSSYLRIIPVLRDLTYCKNKYVSSLLTATKNSSRIYHYLCFISHTPPWCIQCSFLALLLMSILYTTYHPGSWNYGPATLV